MSEEVRREPILRLMLAPADINANGHISAVGSKPVRGRLSPKG